MIIKLSRNGVFAHVTVKLTGLGEGRGRVIKHLNSLRSQFQLQKASYLLTSNHLFLYSFHPLYTAVMELMGPIICAFVHDCDLIDLEILAHTVKKSYLSEL